MGIIFLLKITRYAAMQLLVVMHTKIKNKTNEK